MMCHVSLVWLRHSVVSQVAGVAALAGVGMIVVVVVAVGVAVLVGVGSEVVETWQMSTTRPVICDGDIVSMCCSSSEAHNLVIAFCAHSGNGPDQVSTQFCSIESH